MDQDAFFKITDEELEVVSLDAAPTSGEEYLKQVIVSRRHVPDVVVATNLNFHKFDNNQTVKIPANSIGKSTTAPPSWWCEEQCVNFSELRQKLRRAKAKLKKSGTLPSVEFPQLNNENGWKRFCFEKWCTLFTCNLSPDHAQELRRIHRGTPPLLTVLSAMGQAHVIDAFEFHVAWFVEENKKSLDRARSEWLYALMSVLEKPLPPEVCSSLRDLAKQCAKLKCECESESKSDERRTLDLFICLVVYYFEQKDLIDLL